MLSFVRNVKKIFQEEAFALFLIAILGPFSLFLTLSIASIYSTYSLELPVFVLFSLLLLFTQPKKGWKFALGGLFVLSLFRHFFLKTSHIWELGLESSLSLGVLVTQLSLDQVKSFVKGFKGEVINHKNLLQEQFQIAESDKLTWEKQKVIYGKKEELLQEEILKLQKENTDIQQIKEVLAKNLEELSIDNQDLSLEKAKAVVESRRNSALLQEVQEELLALQNKETLYQEKQNLLTRLNQVRVENYQLHLQIDALRHQRNLISHSVGSSEEVERLKLQLEQTSLALQEAKKEKNDLSLEIDLQEKTQRLQEQEEKVEELTQMLKNHREELTNLRKVRSSYHQLKVQFEEKKKVLHLARKEIFQLNTEKETLEKREIEKEYEQEKILQDQFAEYSFLEVLVEQLEKENQMLTSWLEKS